VKIDLRSPNITAETEREQLLQIRSYLYQLRGQLQWAFENIDVSGSSESGTATAASSAKSTATVNAVSTFAAVKGLIIKSADIVNAYYDEIESRLQGIYVAQSDFGTYTQQTAQTIQQNSSNITQIFENTQTIEADVNSLQVSSEKLTQDIGTTNQTVESLETNTEQVASRVGSLEESTEQLADSVAELQAMSTNAYIKTGLLYEDSAGRPVYGLEIGQTNYVNSQEVFSRFARFCSDKLSFYDSNDTEVAYISDYKLYITNAEITGSLRIINRFKIYYNNGLAFQWIGGSS